MIEKSFNFKVYILILIKTINLEKNLEFVTKIFLLNAYFLKFIEKFMKLRINKLNYNISSLNRNTNVRKIIVLSLGCPLIIFLRNRLVSQETMKNYKKTQTSFFLFRKIQCRNDGSILSKFYILQTNLFLFSFILS